MSYNSFATNLPQSPISDPVDSSAFGLSGSFFTGCFFFDFFFFSSAGSCSSSTPPGPPNLASSLSISSPSSSAFSSAFFCFSSGDSFFSSSSSSSSSSPPFTSNFLFNSTAWTSFSISSTSFLKSSSSSSSEFSSLFPFWLAKSLTSFLANFLRLGLVNEHFLRHFLPSSVLSNFALKFLGFGNAPNLWI